MKYYIEVNGRSHEVDLKERLGELEVLVDGELVEVVFDEIDGLGQALVLSGGRSFGVSIEGDESAVGITIAGHFYDVKIEDERERAAHAAEREAAKHGGLVKSIMPGVVVDLLVKEGDEVAAGQPLLVLEAMKMQNEIEAPHAGVVKAFHVTAGEAVAAGTKLVTLDEA